jgi:PAS domain S-box-containing protein
MSYYTDEVVLQIPGLLMEGKEAVREQFAVPFTTAFPGNRHIVKGMIFGPDVVNVEFIFEAQHKGPFAGHAATGAQVKLPGCGVYQYDSQKRQITAGRIYFDVGTLLQTITDALPGDCKKTEEALRTNERNLSLITNVIPTFIHVLRTDGSVLYVNQAVLGYTGLTLEDVRKADYRARFFHPEDVERLREERGDALARPVPFENEQRVLGKDGKYRWFLIRYNPLLDGQGKIDRWYAAAFDIEDRKRGEEEIAQKSRELERSEFYLREGERLAHMGSWSLKPDGTFDYWSPETFVVFGFDPANGIPTLKEWLGVLHPPDGDRVLLLIRKMFSEGVRGDIQYRLNDVTHGQKTMHSTGEPVLENGKVVRLIGNTLDISEQENAAQELSRREAYLAEAQKLSHTGSFGWDVSTGEIYWSDETFRIFELDPKTKITIELIIQRTHPDDRQAVQEVIKRASRDGTEFALEHRLLMPDGSIKYLQVVGRASTEEGHRSEFVGAVTDITDRKRAETLLAGEKRVLEMIATGIPLKQILNALCLIIEEQRQDTLASILLVNPDGVHLDVIAGPSLPKEWTCHMEKLPIGPRAASCGTAAYRGSPVMVSDIANDPLWDVPEHRAAALSHGLRASWSIPVLSSQGKVLADVCMYCREVRTPTSEDLELIEFAVHQARVAIERDKAIEEIKALRDRLQMENIVLREELGKTSMFEEVIGTSSALQMTLSRAAKVAPTDSTVLIIGETGTGKELIARAIHKRSNRSERPFISVNCAAVPSSLIMSDLFGHEKGAFTGAAQRRLGKFELAEGGTIFLDEVGDLPTETQTALLRVLQEREFERVGGTEVLRADVRVISATNRDLQTAIANNFFRSDLYYRLNVFPIKLPPLRERKEDVPLLVSYFVNRYAKRSGKQIKHVQKDSLVALQDYSWPGNVRELQNIIERSLIIGETNEFSVDRSWLTTEQLANSTVVDQASSERTRIETALAQSNGKVSGAKGAAAKLGVPPSTLESRIRSLKINKFQFKGT